MLRTVVLPNVFVETVIRFIFQDTLMNENFKGQHLFEIEIFCNFINLFNLIFDQFNASLLNKYKSYWPQTVKW